MAGIRLTRLSAPALGVALFVVAVSAAPVAAPTPSADRPGTGDSLIDARTFKICLALSGVENGNDQSILLPEYGDGVWVYQEEDAVGVASVHIFGSEAEAQAATASLTPLMERTHPEVQQMGNVVIGYKPEILADTREAVDACLSGDSAVKDGAEGRVVGTLSLRDKPVDRARVVLFNTLTDAVAAEDAPDVEVIPPPPETKTNEDGRFVFESLPPIAGYGLRVEIPFEVGAEDEACSGKGFKGEFELDDEGQFVLTLRTRKQFRVKTDKTVRKDIAVTCK